MCGGFRFVGLALAAVGCAGCVRTYSGHFSVGSAALNGGNVVVEITCEKWFSEMFNWEGGSTGVVDSRHYTLEFAPAAPAGGRPGEMRTVAAWNGSRLPAAPAAGGGRWRADTVTGHPFGDDRAVVGQAEVEGRVLYLVNSGRRTVDARRVAIVDQGGDVLHEIAFEASAGGLLPQWWDAPGRRVLLTPAYDDVFDLRRGRGHMTAVVWHYETQRLETLRLDMAGALDQRGARYLPRPVAND